MNFFRGIVVSVAFVLSFSGAATPQEPDAESLPPEKTQLIYDTLLPKEMEEYGKSGEKDASKTEMTVKKIVEILRSKDIDLQGKAGQWQFFHEGMQVFLLTSSEGNRMRMMTPLAKLDQLRQNPDFSEIELLQKMMRANYLATGDVRLCLNRHILWAAFLHPLDSLTERELVGALGQLTETVKKTRNDIN
jgi:hypothetical protein